MGKQILVLRFGSLGDVILTSAACTNLKISYPDHRIVYVTKDRFRPVVELIGPVDRIVTLPDSGSALDFLRLVGSLRSERIDYLVDLHGNPRSWLARSLIQARSKSVYPKRRIERLILTRGVKELPAIWPHTVDLYNHAIRKLGGRTPAFRPVLRIPRLSGGRAEWSPPPGNPKVVVAPGAAHPTKKWNLDRFVEVANALRDDLGAGVIWLLAQRDFTKTESDLIRSQKADAILSDWDIPNLAAVIAGADLTLANDSGLAHLSSAVGTPTLAIFGPTHPVLGFAPRGQFDQVIESTETCRPCSRHGKKPCYRDRRYCMEVLTPSIVVARIKETLNSCGGWKPALFVDRDGTLIVDKDYLADPDQVELIDGAVEALQIAAQRGYKIIVVSNQSGVARGYHSMADVDRVNRRLLEILVSAKAPLDATYFCPHHPAGKVAEFSRDCGCRKPAPGMLEEAAAQLGLDLRKSFVIGDKPDDLYLGWVVGARSVLVRTGYGRESEKELTLNGLGFEVSDNLRGAVKMLLGA
jgi:D,D-heptose 1,7-bisphosphate phosphatase